MKPIRLDEEQITLKSALTCQLIYKLSNQELPMQTHLDVFTVHAMSA